VTWICANHTNNAFAANDFAVAANFLHRSRNSHGFLLKLIVYPVFLDQVKLWPRKIAGIHHRNLTIDNKTSSVLPPYQYTTFEQFNNERSMRSDHNEIQDLKLAFFRSESYCCDIK
jgi:hypothetical protein